VQQHHDVDVGGDGVRLGPVPFERGPTHEGAASRQHLLHLLTVVGDHHEVAHCYVGADVAHPQQRLVHRHHHGAPTPIEAAHSTSRTGRTKFAPARQRRVGPPEAEIAFVRSVVSNTRNGSGPTRRNVPLALVANHTDVLSRTSQHLLMSVEIPPMNIHFSL
jgi:hypothetical protein